jgi:hypothetical protein
MAKIPPRNPVGDAFDGVLLRYATATLLATELQDEAEVVAEGGFTVRYGVRYEGKPALALVPGLLALDYGEMLTGDEMWDFMRGKRNLYPRADVLGYRSDGEDTMVVLKKLDFALPLAVLVYESGEATVPVGAADGLIAPGDVTVPARLAGVLKPYPTLAAWAERE